MMQHKYRKYRQLTIAGQTYNPEALFHLSEEKLTDEHVPAWEKEIYRFILEWLSDEDTILVQTSGSTGTPKKMPVRKDAMLQSAFNTIDFFGLTPGMSALLCLPVNYIAGRMMIVRAFAGGLDLVPVPVTGRPLQHLAGPVDFASMIPLQMMNELSVEPSRLHLLRTVMLGGSAVSNELVRKLENQTFRAWETYGMTETLSHIALRPLNGNESSMTRLSQKNMDKTESCEFHQTNILNKFYTDEKNNFFTPLKNVRVFTDERNCLVVDAAGITNTPVVTNDIVEINKNGTFRIKGRIDNIINTGGVKVSPEEIEQRLSGLVPEPFYISSRPHPSLGNEVVLVVPRKPDNVDALLQRLRNVLPPYHAPKDVVEKQPFRMTESGKIRRD
ncbi:MAG: o-succinylbenzoate---CoA ligase [Anaerophaga sp.]|nr:o-succinylbenzoate---CoA ligase [Anaerophaga sp.]